MNPPKSATNLKVDSKGRIRLTSNMLRTLGVKEGDNIEFVVLGGMLIIRSVKTSNTEEKISKKSDDI